MPTPNWFVQVLDIMNEGPIVGFEGVNKQMSVDIVDITLLGLDSGLGDQHLYVSGNTPRPYKYNWGIKLETPSTSKVAATPAKEDDEEILSSDGGKTGKKKRKCV